MSRARAILSRGYFTDWVIGLLKHEHMPLASTSDPVIPVAVGDNNTPDTAYGWQGQPNDGSATFIPWMSVGTGNARPTGGTFGDSASEHVMSYSITYSSVARDQGEWLADKMRKEFGNAERQQVDCGEFGTWKILQVQTMSIGAITRIKSSFPDYYVQTDAFDIWVSKEKA